MLASPARLGLHFEKPANWPAWNMDWKDRQQPARSFIGESAADAPRFRVVETGPVRVALEITREHEGSTYVQTIRLGAGPAGDRVEFDNVIDWTTRERSLKAAFPLAVSNPRATYDIQIGAIERGNNHEKAYEHPAHLWFDLTDKSGEYGVSVINDSKFGSDKPDDSTLRLTLLYTPGTGGEYQDQGTQDIGRHRVLYALAGHQNDWRAGGAASTPWIAARVNQPLRPFVVPGQQGPLGKSFSMAKVSDPNVMVTALKKAEASDAMVMRLRELTGAPASTAAISMSRPIAAVREVDGQEREVGAANVENGALSTDVGGYGLRAFAIQPGVASAKVAPARCTPMELPFDTDVVSGNDKRDDGAMSSDGRSYPAEQLPATINLGAATFAVGPTAHGRKNAVRCRGQTLALTASDANRLELLVASSADDQRVTFEVDGQRAEALVPSWAGYIGQWDNRVWLGPVPEKVFNWQARYAGLDPGYIKPCEVAWFASHHHAPAGDEHYRFCYLFRVAIDVPTGAKTLTLPDNDAVTIFAASLLQTDAHATPAASLWDQMDDRRQDAPVITPAGGTFKDITAVSIAPRLYGRVDAVRYTLDGSQPTPASATFQGPVMLKQVTTVKAALLAPDGTMGPVTQARLMIDDRTPPGLLNATSAFEEPTIVVTFSEPLERTSAGTVANYAFEPMVVIREAVVDDSAQKVTLTLEQPLASDRSYALRVRRVADDSPNHNTIGNAKITVAVPRRVFHLVDVKPEHRGQRLSAQGLPVKASDAWTLNMFVKTDSEPENRTVIAGFGTCDNKAVGGGRYICKFANGVRFWAHNGDLDGKKALQLAQWQMITATSDGRTLRLYLDGELLAERAAELVDDHPIVMIAPQDPWEHQRQFEGEIREFSIWNAALTESAIKSLRQSARLP
jgi:alpha-mannosidase